MIHKLCKKSELILAIVLFFSIFLYCFPVGADSSADSMLEAGKVVGTKMRSLASGKDLEYWTETGDIKAIKKADSLPESFTPTYANTVSVANSKYPVYIFFDNENDAGILYFYSEAKTITMNPDSSFLFAFNTALTDFSGLSSMDSSNVISFYGAFLRDSSISDLTPLANWNTTSLEDMGIMFADDLSLTDISALANWDTSNVTSMYSLFSGVRSLPDALALRNWDTSKVLDMSYMFSSAVSLMFVDVTNWNTSNVTTMASMFQVGDSWKGNGQLLEIIGLGDLDVSNVTDMTCMFYGAGQMTFYDVARWNVSNVESMNHMFCDNFKLRSLDLSAWDVSSVKTIYDMFDDDIKLTTIGDVSHWNTVSLIDAGGWLNEASSFVGNNFGVLDLSGWDTSNLKSAGEMFLHTKLNTIDLSGWTFDAITNNIWEEAGKGIYYETGNDMDEFRGLGSMFKNSKQLTVVYVSASGLDSFNTAVENGVNTLDMWTKCKAGGFTVK